MHSTLYGCHAARHSTPRPQGPNIKRLHRQPNRRNHGPCPTSPAVAIPNAPWDCGFYPGTKPHQDRGDTAATFDQARADFEAAWHRLLPTLTEADFDRWRDARDWTARKYAMWKAGEKMPTQKPNSMMCCPCGATFDSHDPASSYVHRGHIYAKQAADSIRR